MIAIQPTPTASQAAENELVWTSTMAARTNPPSPANM